MSDQLQIKPTERDLDRWVSTFVPSIMLWWWDDSPIPNADNAKRVVHRTDFIIEPLFDDISYVNAFHTWAMSKEVTHVIVDEGEWAAALSEHDRGRASSLQVRFKRGLCPSRDRFANADLPESAVANGRVVLDSTLWESLPDAIKRAVIDSELPDWDDDIGYAVPESTPGHLASIANTFEQHEGMNCLAVTAFAITANRDHLLQWMVPEAFLDVLRNHGFAEIDDQHLRADDVIVFRDEEGHIVHAAYVVAQDRILNKNGQTSFNPISVIDVGMLSAAWSAYSRSFFRR